ncbi:methyltransferase type 11 [Lentzea sp. NBRC 105346]|uniref:SAM-dependent methyltransferase n=1 Tax=Lentzea sp. NBRC 105346 TaxID=3032205 RepID=UPI0024A0E9B9|nr:methyltransferase domain-containing protein [Lentzea sp. NBRC 105346]GLZ29851.1 methyltransferase type 11 [Lentzea sp. NBRC 105346]
MVSTPEQVGEYYDQAVDWFAEVMGDNSHVGYWPSPDDRSTLEEATDNLTDQLIERLEVGPGARVLDVGCGTGRPAVRLSKATGCEVIGIAVSPEQVRRANARAEEEGVAHLVSFQVGNAMELAFADTSFDAAWALESIMHMADRKHVLTEIQRVLRPGGRVALTDLFEADPAGPEQRAALEGYLAGMESSMAEIDDYPGIVTAAGLRIAELLDITGRTQERTRTEVAKVLERKKHELTAQFGPQWTEIFERMAEQADAAPEIGYLLLVARKP